MYEHEVADLRHHRRGPRARADAYGAMGAQIAIPPCLATSVATYPIRATFRSRSCLENVEPGRQQPPAQVAVQQRHRTVASLEQRVPQVAGER